MATLEHVNITSSNPSRLVDFLRGLFGWVVRWQGPSQFGGETWHVGQPGQGDGYVAVYGRQDRAEAEPAGYEKGQPLNHIAVVIDDLDAAEEQVLAAGLNPYSHGSYEPGHRFYFFDWDGIEWEVVSYAPQIPRWVQHYTAK